MIILALLLTAGATPAERIAHGQQLLEQLDYELASDEFMRAAVDPNATEDQRIMANLYAGIAHRIAGKDVEARGNFRYVLLRKPDWQIEQDASPKVVLFFEGVRQELLAERAATTVAPEPRSLPPAAAAASPAEPGGASIAAVVVAATGAAGALAGASGVVYAETSLADPSRPGGERSGLRALGQWSTGALIVGGVLAGVGGTLLLVGGS